MANRHVTIVATMTTTIALCSEKGGVGKTTSAVNLATALALGGYRVLLVDLDPQGSVRYSFGLREPVRYGTHELLTREDLPLSTIAWYSEDHGMDYVFSNVENPRLQEAINRQLPHDALLRRLNHQARDYDFVILDTPASTNRFALNAMMAAELVIAPLQCEALAVKSLKAFLAAFRRMQARYNPALRIAGVLICMYDRQIEVHRRISRQLYEALGDSVFSTIIPKAKEITEASALGCSVITYQINSVGATAYVRFSRELLDRFQLRHQKVVS